MTQDGTPDLNRRRFLQATGAVGLAGALGGVASATPGRSPGPKEDEILVGVAQGDDSPADVVTKAVPGKARIVHENKTLSYVAVKFPSQAADVARENFIEAGTK